MVQCRLRHFLDLPPCHVSAVVESRQVHLPIICCLNGLDAWNSDLQELLASEHKQVLKRCTSTSVTIVALRHWAIYQCMGNSAFKIFNRSKTRPFFVKSAIQNFALFNPFGRTSWGLAIALLTLKCHSFSRLQSKRIRPEFFV